MAENTDIMEKQQFLELLDTYEKRLARLGHRTPMEVSLSRTIHRMESRNLVLGHCLQVIRAMRKQAENVKVEDLAGGLIFIQGCFWTNGVYTINQMQKHNKTRD